LDDLILAWKKDAAVRGMTASSIYNYSRYLVHFLDFLNGTDIRNADSALIRDYVEYLRSRSLRTKSIEMNLLSVSSLFEYLIFERKVKENPVRAIRRRYLNTYKTDSEVQKHKIISIEEATKLVDSAVDIRDKAVITLLLKTGIRRGELTRLDLVDVNWQDKSITLKPTKKRSNRVVFFDEETAGILRRWAKVREGRNLRGSPALFVSPRGRLEQNGVASIVNKAAIAAGLHDLESKRMEDHFSSHCCRHWFTTHLRRSGMPREFIKELRGDVRREAIDVYDHIDKKELRESYLAHIPQLGI